MDHREYAKLWRSLTPEERRAAMMIKAAQEDQRKTEFYRAKAERGEKLPNNWDPSSWQNDAK